VKLTNKIIKKMIKEEIDAVVNEQQESQIQISDKEIQDGKKMQYTPIGSAIFDMLLNDPNVQRELKNVGSQTNEENVGGQIAVAGGIGGAAVAGASIQTAVFTGLTSGKLGLAVAGVLKGAGIAGAAMISGAAAGFLVFVALGGAAAYLGAKSMGKSQGSEIDSDDGEEIGSYHPRFGELTSKQGGLRYQKTPEWEKWKESQ